MPRLPLPRLPFDPAQQIIAARYTRDDVNANGVAGSLHHCAEVLGVDRSQVARWRRDGVTPTAADHIAVKLGFHPANIWPEWLGLTGRKGAA